MAGADARRLSSLPLQVVIYFSGWYLVLLYPAMMAGIVYKAVTLSYPAGSLAAEIILLLILAVLDATRIFLGAKGNLTARQLPLFLSLLFTLPILCAYLYLTIWQTHV